MIGLLDIGGGMRGAYAAGVYDYLLEQGIQFDYCLGVSAGSANIMSYLSGQRGRNIIFYTEYNMRREYMSLSNFRKKGCYLDLDYVYSTLSNEGGERALNFDTVLSSPVKLVVTVTRACDGQPAYFTNRDLTRNHLDVIKASSALPFFCRPQQIGGEFYFDGGVANPIPIEKCFADGCDKVLLLLNRPADQKKAPEKFQAGLKFALRKYPAVFQQIQMRHKYYNRAMEKISQYEKEGKALLMAPSDACGVGRLTRNPPLLGRLYGVGYFDAKAKEAQIRQLFQPGALPRESHPPQPQDSPL